MAKRRLHVECDTIFGRQFSQMSAVIMARGMILESMTLIDRDHMEMQMEDGLSSSRFAELRH